MLAAVESDESYFHLLSTSVPSYRTLDEVPFAPDAIYLIDVLEHIEDDSALLDRFYDKLKTGGRLFIYVPARSELYSAFDEKIGHYRRYTLADLSGKVTSSGFVIEKVRYHDLLGYFASMMNKVFGSGKNFNPFAVRLYDKLLFPLTNVAERFIKAPFGKSIYLSGRKEGQNTV
jgi:hypothetical protein